MTGQAREPRQLEVAILDGRVVLFLEKQVCDFCLFVLVYVCVCVCVLNLKNHRDGWVSTTRWCAYVCVLCVWCLFQHVVEATETVGGVPQGAGGRTLNGCHLSVLAAPDFELTKQERRRFQSTWKTREKQNDTKERNTILKRSCR